VPHRIRELQAEARRVCQDQNGHILGSGKTTWGGMKPDRYDARCRYCKADLHIETELKMKGGVIVGTAYTHSCPARGRSEDG
jgi:hypothetical protein